MATPAQLFEPLIVLRGTTFDLPMRIADANGDLIDWTGKEVRFQVADKTDPNRPCCDDTLSVNISSEDDDSAIDLSTFPLDGNSPPLMGNFRLTIPAAAPANDSGNQNGITLTGNMDCQETTFRIVMVTPSGDPDVPETVDPLVLGRISIVGM